MDDAPKRCTYCLAPHNRRGRACSEYCERRTRSAKSAMTGWHTRARRKYMAALQAKVRHNGRWRKVAMDHEAAGQLQAIFGVEPSRVEQLTSEVRGGCALDINP